MNEKILIIDSDEKWLDILKVRLEGENYKVFISNRASEGFKIIKDEYPEIVVLDYYVPDRNSIEVLNEIRKNYSNSLVVMTSGQGIEESALELIKAGASDYFVKPLNINKFVNVI